MREDIVLRVLTRRRDWTPIQQEMMHRAGVVHLRRGGLFAFAVVVLAAVAFWVRAEMHAEALVDTLINADIDQVPHVIDQLKPFGFWANPKLQKARDSAQSDDERVRAALALLPTDSSQLDYIRERLLVYDPESFPTLYRLLSPYSRELSEPLWKVLEAETANADARLQAACFLAQSSRDSALRRAGKR